jgi:prepilin signal peptidase PulO-like enzyme (type II secretory pathway)
MLTLFFGYGFHEIILTAASIGVGGGIFYVLYKVSMGKWIGGGDVKLGFLVGAILGDPLLSILYIFVASLVGTVYAAPLLLSGRLKRTSHLPFGPFLIISAYITVIFGQRLLDGYMQLIGL